jgi:hypothetical protein
MSANRNSLPKKPLPLFKQPRAGPSGSFFARRQSAVYTHRSPGFCFASAHFPSQTRTATVAVRFRQILAGKPTPFRSSGSHSPPRWRTRERRSEYSRSLRFRAKITRVFPYVRSTLPLPFTRKERIRGLSGRLKPAWPQDQPTPNDRFGLPARLLRQNTRRRTFLRNLLTITRNPRGVNEGSSKPVKFRKGLLPWVRKGLLPWVGFEANQLMECIAHAPFSRAKSAWRWVLRRLMAL